MVLMKSFIGHVSGSETVSAHDTFYCHSYILVLAIVACEQALRSRMGRKGSGKRKEGVGKGKRRGERERGAFNCPPGPSLFGSLLTGYRHS